MGQSSIGWTDEEDDNERMPLDGEDRGSESLESPAFQQAKPDSAVADSARAAEAIEPPGGGEKSSSDEEAPAETSSVSPAESESSPAPQQAPSPARPVRQRVGNISDLLPGSPFPAGYVPRSEHAAQFAQDEAQREAHNTTAGLQMARQINSADPYQADDGRWVRRRADPISGDIHEVDLLGAGLGKIDQKTGNITAHTSMGPVVIGQDSHVAALAQLVQQRTAARSDVENFRADAGVTRSQLNDLNATMKQQFGPLPDALQLRLKTAMANFSLNPADEKFKQKADDAQQALNTWRAANPDYGFMEKQRDALTSKLLDQNRTYKDGQQRAAELASNINYVRATGSLPPTSVSAGPGDVPIDQFQTRAAEISAIAPNTSHVEAMRQAAIEAQQSGAKSIGGVDIGTTLKNFDAVKPKDTAPEKPQAEGLVASFMRPIESGIAPALGTAGGAMGGAALAGLIGLPSGPGAIAAAAAGDVAGGAAGGYAVQKIQDMVMGDQWTKRQADQIQADMEAHPVAVKMGAFVPAALSMLGGGKLLQGALKGFLERSAEKAGTQNAPYLARMLAAIPGNMILGARMATGEAGQQIAEGNAKPADLLPAAIKGAATMGPVAMIPAATGVLKAVLAKAPADAAVLAMSNALYDHFVSGKPIDPRELTTNIGTDIPGFMVMNAIGALLHHPMTATGNDGVPDPSKVNAAKTADAASAVAPAVNAAADASAKVATAQASGDAAELAKALDAKAAAENQAHINSQAAMLAIPEETRRGIARVAGPDADFDDAEKQLAADPVRHFGLMGLGEGVRDAYVSPERQAAIARMADGAGVDANLAQRYGDQIVGTQVVRDLGTVLTNGSIPAAKADALVDAGLLQRTTEPDGSTKMRVTDDALPLLPEPLQKAVATRGDELAYTKTAGNPGDALAKHMQIGMARMGQTSEALLAKINEPQPDRSFKVRVVSRGENASGKTIDAIDIAAPNAAEAEQRARAQSEQGGRMVVTARAQEMKRATAAEPAGVVPTVDDWKAALKAAPRVRVSDDPANRLTKPDVTRVTPDAPGGTEVVFPDGKTGTLTDRAVNRVMNSREVVLEDGTRTEWSPAIFPLYDRESLAKHLPKNSEPAGVVPDGQPAARAVPNPATGQHRAYSADEATGEMRRLYVSNRELFKAIGIEPPTIEDGPKAARISADGKFVISPKALEAESANLARNGFDSRQWMNHVAREELLHGVQIKAEAQAGRNWEETYHNVWNDPHLPQQLKDGASRAYVNWDKMSDAQKGAEAVRMVLDGRWKGTITERVFRAIEDFVKYLRGLDPKAQESPLFREVVERAEKVLQEAKDKAGHDWKEAVEGAEVAGGEASAPEASAKKLTPPGEDRNALGNERASAKAPAPAEAAPTGAEGAAEPGGDPDWDVGAPAIHRMAGEDESAGERSGEGVLRSDDAMAEPPSAAEVESPSTGRERPAEIAGRKLSVDAESGPAMGQGSDAGSVDENSELSEAQLAEQARQEADARRETGDEAMRDAGYESLFEAVRRMGGLPSQKHASAEHHGEELLRVLDALRERNRKARTVNDRLLNRHIFSDSPRQSPDEIATKLGFDDANHLFAALEEELTTGKTHWINPDAEGQRGSDGTSNDDRDLTASRTADTGTMSLGLDEKAPGSEPAREQTPREKVLAEHWQRLTAKLQHGEKLTEPEQRVYLQAEKELGQKFLVDMDDSGLQRGAESKAAEEKRAQAEAVKAGQSRRLTAAPVERNVDLFSGRAEDAKGNAELFASGTGDEAIKSPQDLAKENVGLAVKIAGDYRNIPGVETGDVAGEAKIALMKAAKSFDPAKGSDFAAYAGRSIRNRLNDLYGKEARHASREETTLDAPAMNRERGTRNIDHIADSNGPDVTSATDRKETQHALMESVNSLAERPREILMARLRGKTLESIAKDYLGGVSKERARQVVDTIMDRVKSNLAEKGLTRVEADGTLAASSTDEGGARERATKQAVADFRKSVADPEKTVRLATKEDGRIVLNADDLVATSEAMKTADKNDGPRIAAALKPLADAARERAFEHLISKPPNGEETVVLTAGGPGSGKSSTGTDQHEDAAFVYDSVLGDRTKAEKLINRVLASGRKAEIAFVARDPAEAMRANLERSLTAKRLVSADRLASLHVAARQTLHDIASRYADDPRVQINATLNRSGEKPQEIAPRDVPLLDLDETKARVHSVLDGIANRTDPEWKDGELPPGILAAARGVLGEAERGSEAEAGKVQSGDSGSEAPGSAAARDNPGELGGDSLGASSTKPVPDGLLAQAERDAAEQLTGEQRDILGEVRRGKNVAEIAGKLGLSNEDVRSKLEEANIALFHAKNAAIDELTEHIKQVEPAPLYNLRDRVNDVAAKMAKQMSAAKAMFAGAKEGFEFGKEQHGFIERQKAEMAGNLRKLIVEALPVTERGPLAEAVSRLVTEPVTLRADGKNEQRLQTLFKRAVAIAGKVYDQAEDLRKKAIVDGIKDVAKRVADSPGVDVVYQKRIRGLMRNLDFSKARPGTVASLEGTKDYIEGTPDHAVPDEIVRGLDRLNRLPVRDLPTHVLESILGDMALLEKLGRLKVRTREAVKEARREAALSTMAAAKTTPLNLTPVVKAQPGERLPWQDKVRNWVAKKQNYFRVFDRALLPMAAVADGLGDGKGRYDGPLERHIHGPIDTAYNLEMVDRKALLRPMEDLIAKNKFTPEDGERLAVHATLQQEGGEARLRSMGVEQRAIDANRTLTGPLAEAYQQWKHIEQSIFPEVSRVAREEFNQSVEKVENYFPMMRDHEAFKPDQAPVETESGETIKYDPMAMLRGLVDDFSPMPKRRTEAGFTKERVERAGTPIRLDGFQVIRRHVQDALHFIHSQPVINDAARVVADPVFEQKYGDAGQKIYRDYLDTVARQGGVDATRRIATLDLLRKRLGMGVIAFRLASNIKHISNMPFAMFHVGPDWYLKGAREALSPQAQAWIGQHMAEISARHGAEPAQEEIESSSGIPKGLGQLWQAGRQYGFWIARNIDRINAQSTALGGYLRELSNAGIDPDSYLTAPVDRQKVNRALRLMRRSVASPLYKDIPQALARGTGVFENASVARTLLAFQNVFLDQWSNLRHDLWRSGIREKNAGKALAMGGTLAAVVLMETGIVQGVRHLTNTATGHKDKNEESFGETLLKDSLRRFPFMGQMMQLAMFGRTGVPLFDSITDSAKSARQAFTGKTPETRSKNAVKAASGVATLLGVPGAGQAGELLRDSLPDSPKGRH